MKSQEHRTERFDVVALHAAMDSERRSRRLTWKEVAVRKPWVQNPAFYTQIFSAQSDVPVKSARSGSAADS